MTRNRHDDVTVMERHKLIKVTRKGIDLNCMVSGFRISNKDYSVSLTEIANHGEKLQ